MPGAAKIPPAPVAFLVLIVTAGLALAQSPGRRIDVWSGLLVACKSDAKLDLPADSCAGIVAAAAKLATAGQIKFAVLAVTDSAAAKTAKAKAAGIDDASAIEMLIDVKRSDSSTAIASVDVDALSRLHKLPGKPGAEPQYLKVYSQSGAISRDAPDWQALVAPTARQLLGIFFEIYLKPAKPPAIMPAKTPAK